MLGKELKTPIRSECALGHYHDLYVARLFWNARTARNCRSLGSGFGTEFGSGIGAEMRRLWDRIGSEQRKYCTATFDQNPGDKAIYVRSVIYTSLPGREIHPYSHAHTHTRMVSFQRSNVTINNSGGLGRVKSYMHSRNNTVLSCVDLRIKGLRPCADLFCCLSQGVYHRRSKI